jgi:DNA replication and repair protein RecF
MFVRSIYLDGFRNYSPSTAEFSEHVNVITGENAQGKTNLLEAVFYLSCGRSFRTRGDREVIGRDRDSAVILAEAFSDGRDHDIGIRLFRGRKKEITVNGVRLKKASELSGRLSVVLFCPDDLMLVREGASVRRRMMDLCLCQLRPRYAEALAEFTRLYEHKTRILRDWREKPSLLDTLEDFNDRLARAGAILIYYRAALVKNLSGKAADIHREFSGGHEELSLTYRTVSGVPGEPGMKPREIYPLLVEHQQRHRRAELESGMCLSGAHKDDIEITINGMPARSYASQGQARTAALSIKLAERDIHFEDRGDYPILLLDDVLSELDGERQSFVLNRILTGQVLLTCCEDENIAARTGGRIIRISGGTVLSS